MKHIIIGASAAGLAAAEEIRKTDATAEITVLTEEAYLPYSRPSISYYLKGKVTERDMALRKASAYKASNINIVTGSRVTAIDKDNKVVKVGRKSYKYDKLCIATGSVPFVPPMENVSGKSNALTFLDLAAAKQLKELANSVNAIDFFGLRICTCGLINAVGEQYSDKIATNGSSYKRLVLEGDRLVGFVLINSSDNAGIYTSLIANKISLDALDGDIMDTPSIFMFDKNTRIEKLRGGVNI